MANPQSEAGHTRIANELLEAILRYPFTGQELKIVLFVARETYGWSRTKAQISYGAISRATGICRRNAIRICQRLLEKQVLFFEGFGKRYAHTMGICKNYELWSVDKVVASGPLPSDAQATRDSGAQTTRDSGAQTTRDGDAQTTPSKQKAIKQSENKQRLKDIAATRSRISRLIAGKEGCITNCDPRPVIRILVAEGFDRIRVWGALIQCKTKRNPAGYLVKSLSDPDYAVADSALAKGKAEMQRWEDLERADSEVSVSESAALINGLAQKLSLEKSDGES